jgi:hypothetical protein
VQPAQLRARPQHVAVDVVQAEPRHAVGRIAAAEQLLQVWRQPRVVDEV